METVPVIVAKDLTDAQVQAYRLADNRVAEFSEWDVEMLKVELDECPVDLDFAMFDDLLADIDQPAAETMEQGDPDEVPAEAQGEPVSQRGEIFELGPHRLMCGDSTSAEDWQALMGQERANACVTDPPYGLGDTSSGKNKYDTHDDTKENLTQLIEKVHPLMAGMTNRIILTPGTRNHRLWPSPSWTMAWFTPAGVGIGPWGFCCWQPILCYGKDPMLANGKGSHPDALVHTEGPSSDQHPCAKPIKFWCWLMNRVTMPGEIVLEPFGGSGTTLIAAAKTGRVCRAMEIAPRYCDVIRRRWTKFAKENGVNPGSGALE
jgi:site-specific DNA-methyltransferase (adenine-specific)